MRGEAADGEVAVAASAAEERLRVRHELRRRLLLNIPHAQLTLGVSADGVQLRLVILDVTGEHHRVLGAALHLHDVFVTELRDDRGVVLVFPRKYTQSVRMGPEITSRRVVACELTCRQRLTGRGCSARTRAPAEPP